MRAETAAVFLMAWMWTAGSALAADPPPGETATEAESAPPVQPDEIPAEVLAAFDEALRNGVDPLDALHKAAEDQDPKKQWKGIAYALTKGNALDPGFLVQTPRIWDKKAEEVQENEGLFVAKRIGKLVASAELTVDITTLRPFPTGGFDAALVDGLKEIAKSGHPVSVRILAGWPPGSAAIDHVQYLKDLVKELNGIPGSKLAIYSGALRSHTQESWNHAKIVAVDGREAWIGGQNLWDSVYLRFYPVHDLSIVLRGPSAFSAHVFADKLWESVCKYWSKPWLPVTWKAGWPDVKPGCLPTAGIQEPAGPGSLRVLGIGRLGAVGSAGGNASDIVLPLALRTSQSTIRISQQDLGVLALGLWAPVREAVAQALIAKRHVYAALTSDGAKAGPHGASYWARYKLTQVADEIRAAAAKIPGAPPAPELNKLLCSNLHLAPIRFGCSSQWPNGFKIANHAKFYMVDDRLFYVGSQNLYPLGNLQEYGVLLNDEAAAQQVRQEYWDPLWKHSVAAAISGGDSPNPCYFLSNPAGSNVP